MNIELTEVIIAIVGVVTAWACKELALWLRNKAKTEKEKALIDRLEYSVSVSVGGVAQTLVKKALDSHSWNDNTKAFVKTCAKDIVKDSLTKENLKAINDLYGNEHTEQLIDMMIEHRVAKDKLKILAACNGVKEDE